MPVNRAAWTHPDLQSLTGLFYDDTTQLGSFEEIQAETMPQPFRKLLAHTDHMTVSMEKHHTSPVAVKVLETHKTNIHYSRKILLTRASDGAVVQFGIVRLNTSYLAPDVRAEIESQRAPLGRILIKHNVLRHVKLMSIWKIEPAIALKQAFANDELETCYGRTALIYTNSVPAVELLEIVIDV